MVFIKANGPSEGRQYLVQALLGALGKNLKTLWLVSGGSNAPLAAEVLRALPDNKLVNLTVAMVDERYGKVGHPDSNQYKLSEAGFDFSRVNFAPILGQERLSLYQTADTYENRLQAMFKESDKIIGQFGIGEDGHTAGILPHSAACRIDDRLVIGYRGPDFERVTLSFPAIKQVDEAYIFAYGEEKSQVLHSLYEKDLALANQPAQIFRQSQAKSFIINNIIGDSA